MNAFLKHYLPKTLKSLIELRQIVESGGTTVNICSYVQTYTGIRQSNNHIIWQYIHELFKVWPDFLGILSSLFRILVSLRETASLVPVVICGMVNMAQHVNVCWTS